MAKIKSLKFKVYGTSIDVNPNGYTSLNVQVKFRKWYIAYLYILVLFRIVKNLITKKWQGQQQQK